MDVDDWLPRAEPWLPEPDPTPEARRAAERLADVLYQLREGLEAVAATQSRGSRLMDPTPTERGPASQAARYGVSSEVTQAALREWSWEPLAEEVRSRGGTLATVGVDLQLTSQVVQAVRGQLMDALIDLHCGDPPLLKALSHAADTYFTVVMSSLSAGYQDAMRAIIRRRERDSQHLAALVESAVDAIFSKDLNGRISSWNAAAERMFGYQAEEILGRHIDALIPPPLMEEEQELVSRVKAGDRIHEVETVRLSKSGERLEVALTMAGITDQRGAICSISVIVRSLAHRKQTEREARMWANAFRAAGASMAIATSDGLFAAVNPAFAKLYGYEVDELLGTPTVHLMRPSERPRSEETVERIHALGHHIFDMPNIRKDGTWFPARVDATAIRDSAGEVEYRFVTVQDMTERRTAEAALRSSEARKASILSAALDAIITIDAEGVVLEFNPAAEEMFGYRSDEMIGRQLAETIIPAEYRDAHHEGMRRYQESGVGPILGQRRELHAQRRDGIRFPVEITVVRSGDGDPATFTSFLRDITERNQYQERLAKAEARLKNIINSMPSMLVAVDADGRVTHWNNQASEVTGTPAAEAIGRLAEEVLPSLRAALSHIGPAIEHKEPSIQEKVSAVLGGQTRSTNVMIYPLVTNGVIGAVVRVDDITDRARLEEIMIQSEKMLSVGGLAAGMAHEINNPLGAILQGCQNLKRRLTTALPRNRLIAAELGLDFDLMQRYLGERDVLRFVDGIQEAGARAACIVSDMLAFSRRGGAAPRQVNLRSLVESTVRLAETDYDLKKIYDFRHIRLQQRVSSGLGPVVCDPINLQQVLLNLLKNAAQAMAGAGTVDPTIIIDVRQDADFAIIAVEDNGPGMPESVRRRVFEPFFTTKQVGLGTGLGLSVSYFIVNQHGGTLSVDSELGGGSRFTIRLPLVGG